MKVEVKQIFEDADLADQELLRGRLGDSENGISTA
jgi:hypothetical protein